MQGVCLVLVLKAELVGSEQTQECVDVRIRHGQKAKDPEQPNPSRSMVIVRGTDGEDREYLADQVARIEVCTFGDPMSDEIHEVAGLTAPADADIPSLPPAGAGDVEVATPSPTDEAPPPEQPVTDAPAGQAKTTAGDSSEPQ